MSNSIPRLSVDEVAPAIQDLMRAKVERLGYFGEFFQCAAHQPEALVGFINFTQHAKDALDMRLVETVALTIAKLKNVTYESHQHQRLSIKLGFGQDWISDVEKLTPEHTTHMKEIETRVQSFVLKSMRDDASAPHALDLITEDIGAERAVAVLLVTGRYAAHALMVKSLNIQAPVSSIWDDGFNG